MRPSVSAPVQNPFQSDPGFIEALTENYDNFCKAFQFDISRESTSFLDL